MIRLEALCFGEAIHEKQLGKSLVWQGELIL
jgi:hypothetical protein